MDYFNPVFSNLTKKSAAEYVQNSAARFLTRTKNIFTIFTETIMIIIIIIIKSLLETNFTSSLKPTIIFIANLKYKP